MHLDSMPRVEKEEVLRLFLREKEKREMERLSLFLPNPGFQERFFKSSKKIRLVVTGNQCLHGDSEIFDPVFGGYRRLSEIKADFHVYAFDGKSLVVAEARKPFIKAVDELYDIRLSTGRKFTSTLAHLVLKGTEYVSVEQHLSSVDSLLGSNLEFDPLTRGEDDRNYFGRVQDSQFYCLVCQNFCDGPLHCGAEAFPSVVPSRVGAQEHISYGGHLDASAYRSDGTHSYQGWFRPANLDALHQNGGHDVGILSRDDGKLLIHVLDLSQELHQQNCGFGLQPQSIVESDLHRSGFSYDETVKVIGADYKEISEVWDFHVPGYNNYFLAGMIHHNSGKTTVAAAETACLALGKHPHKKSRTPNQSMIISGQGFREGIEKTIIPKFKEVVGRYDIKSIKNNSQNTPVKIIWSNESVTHLMSYEQDDMVFEGTTFDFAWIDEPVRRQIYTGLLRGLMARQGLLFMTCTPLNEPWIYDQLYLTGMSGANPDIEVFEGTTFENIKLPVEEIERLKRLYTSDEIEARLYGKFRHLSGKVFKEYNPELNRIPSFDIPSHWPVYCAIDPHRNKPHAALWIAVSPTNVKYVCNELFYACTIKELARIVLEISEQYNIISTVIDTSAQEDGWDKISARQIIHDQGVYTKLAQKRNKKSSGILLINQLLKEQKLFIMEHCKRLHSEFLNQVYKRNKRDEQIIIDEPEKKFDDSCFVAGTMIATPFGDKAIETLKSGNYVVTPLGIKKITKLYPTRISQVVTNLGITGTPDHPVFTWNHGFKDLDSVTEKDNASRLCWKELMKFQKEYHSMEKSFFLQGRDVITSLRKRIIEKEKTQKDFTSPSGKNTIKELSQKASSFITKTATPSIMTFLILSFYHVANMARSIGRPFQRNGRKRDLDFLKKLGPLLKNGTHQKMGEGGTQSTEKKLLKTESLLQRFVKTVKNLTRQFSHGEDFAEMPARQISTDSQLTERTGLAEIVKKSSEYINGENKSFVQELVYNMTVEGNHVYYANGLLVHNTDCLRYVLVENPTYSGPARVKDANFIGGLHGF